MFSQSTDQGCAISHLTVREEQIFFKGVKMKYSANVLVKAKINK
jgi:hypothetical protein